MYISSDTSLDQQLDYMNKKHPDWLTIPCNDPATTALKRHFQTFAGKERAAVGGERKNGIPTIIVLDQEGSAVTDKGEDLISSRGHEGVAAFD